MQKVSTSSLVLGGTVALKKLTYFSEAVEDSFSVSLPAIWTAFSLEQELSFYLIVCVWTAILFVKEKEEKNKENIQEVLEVDINFMPLQQSQDIMYFQYV